MDSASSLLTMPHDVEEELAEYLPKASDRYQQEMVACWKYMHTNPEQSNKEFGITHWLATRVRANGDDCTFFGPPPVGAFQYPRGMELPPPEALIGNGLIIDIGVDEALADPHVPVIGRRADMDALPPLRTVVDTSDKQITAQGREADEKRGAHHGCGHDFHTAVQWGVYKALADLSREDPTLFHSLYPGGVRLIFQPAEEVAATNAVGPIRTPGGFASVAAGAYELPDGSVLNGACALHVKPGGEAGHVAVRAGDVTAGAETYEVEFEGIDGHTGHLAQTLPPGPIAASTYLFLAPYIKMGIDHAVATGALLHLPGEEFVLTDQSPGIEVHGAADVVEPKTAAMASATSLHVGETASAVSRRAVIEGMIRSHNALLLRQFREGGLLRAVRAAVANATPTEQICGASINVELLADGVSVAPGVEVTEHGRLVRHLIDVVYDATVPPVKNSARAADFTRRAVALATGKPAVEDIASKGGEDWGWVWEFAKGIDLVMVRYYLGETTKDGQPIGQLHSLAMKSNPDLLPGALAFSLAQLSHGLWDYRAAGSSRPRPGVAPSVLAGLERDRLDPRRHRFLREAFVPDKAAVSAPSFLARLVRTFTRSRNRASPNDPGLAPVPIDRYLQNGHGNGQVIGGRQGNSGKAGAVAMLTRSWNRLTGQNSGNGHSH